MSCQLERCTPLQVIAEPDERYEAYCKSSDFIREHIFPGGHLPCMGVMVESARGTGLTGARCLKVRPVLPSCVLRAQDMGIAGGKV